MVFKLYVRNINRARWRRRADQAHRRRENMVGVNNVAHDAICECFEGIVLELCLLQPCFHVARLSTRGRACLAYYENTI